MQATVETNKDSSGGVTTATAVPVENGISKTAYYPPTGEKVRLGSRKVLITQLKKFSMLPTDAKAQQIRDEVVKRVGAQWKRGTKDVIRGLNAHEEQLYLPKILGLKPDHDSWETRVKEHWFNFTVEVPAKDGVVLEAGFKLMNGSKDEAEPIDPVGYMSYKWCKENSDVANEDEYNPLVHTFRMVDTLQEGVKAEEAFTLRRGVDAAFLKLCMAAENTEEAARKIDWILETYGGLHGIGMSVYGLTLNQKMLELEKVKDKDLNKFKTILDDPHLESKAIIRRAVSYSKIVQEGTTFVYNGIVMGNTLSAAIHWLNDPNNSAHKIIILEALRNMNR